MGVQKSFNLSTLKILAPWVLPIWMSKCCYETPWVSLGMQQNLKQANYQEIEYPPKKEKTTT
jgi:hypothetical protein